MPARLEDGLFIAVDVNGEVCCGANNSGTKLYVYESVAIKKAKIGGKVYRVTSTDVTLVWLKPMIFFLNEKHEF